MLKPEQAIRSPNLPIAIGEQFERTPFSPVRDWLVVLHSQDFITLSFPIEFFEQCLLWGSRIGREQRNRAGQYKTKRAKRTKEYTKKVASCTSRALGSGYRVRFAVPIAHSTTYNAAEILPCVDPKHGGAHTAPAGRSQVMFSRRHPLS